jgi:dihydrofolate synthase/folylpolyglutamate synthase
VREEVGDEATIVYSDAIDALESARDWAGEEGRRAVGVAGSNVLVGQAMLYAEEQEWKKAAS